MSKFLEEDQHNLLDEDRLSLTKLAQEEKVSVCTPWRWAQKGAKGAKLETICVGGKRQTSRQAFARFVAATTAATVGEKPKTRSNRARESAIFKAEDELNAEGI